MGFKSSKERKKKKKKILQRQQSAGWGNLWIWPCTLGLLALQQESQRGNLKKCSPPPAPPEPQQVPPSHFCLVLKRNWAECECGQNGAPPGQRPLEEPVRAWGSVPGSVPNLALTQRHGSSVTSVLFKQHRLSFIFMP